jgi:hypothetical protein
VLPGVQPGKLRQIRPRDYLIRFALGAGVSIVAGILSKTVSARFGGAFLAFPSILPASLTLIQKKAAFGHIEPFAVLVLALAGWAVTSLALYGLLAFLRPESCDRTKD